MIPRRARLARTRAQRRGFASAQPLLGDGNRQVKRRLSPLHWCGQRLLAYMRKPKDKARLLLDAAIEHVEERIIVLEDNIGFAHEMCIQHAREGNHRLALWSYGNKASLEQDLVVEYEKRQMMQESMDVMDASLEAEPMLQAMSTATALAKEAMSTVRDERIRSVLQEQGEMMRATRRMTGAMREEPALQRKMAELRGDGDVADAPLPELTGEDLLKLDEIQAWARGENYASAPRAQANPDRAFPPPREIPPPTPGLAAPIVLATTGARRELGL